MRARDRLLPTLLIALLAACESYPDITTDPGDEGGSSNLGGGGNLGGSGGSGGTQIAVGGATGLGGAAGQGGEAVCGNGALEAGELCDDGNTGDGDGCAATCTEQDPDYVCLEPGQPCVKFVNCGSGVLEGDEACDDANLVSGDGCAADCSQVEDGWLCPRPGRPCVAIPVCGNGGLERSETCDDGNAVSGDGCSGTDGDTVCQLEDGFWCPAAGEACAAIACGDGLRSLDEECDDGDAEAGDGCSEACSVEDGWLCTAPGTPCIPVCGDGLRRGAEECDDGNRENGDGCNAACRLEPSYVCSAEGSDCVPTVCGNEVEEPGEGCDDGALVAGDGCSPACQSEPTVSVGPDPVVNVFCGDGMRTGAEACDDGNADAGDGCSPACVVEDGFACEQVTEYPETVTFRVTYRDFLQRSEGGGHPHMRVANTTPPRAGTDRGIPGAICNTTNGDSCGRLDAEGKPQLAAGVTADNIETEHPTLYAYPDAFGLWYRSTNPDGIAGANGPIEIQEVPDSLTLTQEGGAGSGVYSYDNSAFWPLDGRFDDTPGQTHNFHFTTELRYFFQYQGGETLTFRGDDDVFVYVNGRLAVDIGGIHTVQWARVVLGDDGTPSGGDSDCTVATNNEVEPDACSATAEELADTGDERFGLVKGGVYEIAFFHAERHPVASNFRLTLAGFLAPRSFCTPVCGDGIIAGWEVCDDGANNTGDYGRCNATCTALTYCGDAIRQGPDDTPPGPEQCDDGYNNALYASRANACAAECTLPPFCGDGNVDAAFEFCDAGADNADDAYDGCTTSCDWGPYCGDGLLQAAAGEQCDEGADNVPYSATGSACGPDCTPAPYCGDGIRNSSEQCDDGAAANNGEYGGCNANCTRAPYCGDHVVQTGEGERCDDGPAGSLSCTPTCEPRTDIH